MLSCRQIWQGMGVPLMLNRTLSNRSIGSASCASTELDGSCTTMEPDDSSERGRKRKPSEPDPADTEPAIKRKPAAKSTATTKTKRDTLKRPAATTFDLKTWAAAEPLLAKHCRTQATTFQHSLPPDWRKGRFLCRKIGSLPAELAVSARSRDQYYGAWLDFKITTQSDKWVGICRGCHIYGRLVEAAVFGRSTLLV